VLFGIINWAAAAVIVGIIAIVVMGVEMADEEIDEWQAEQAAEEAQSGRNRYNYDRMLRQFRAQCEDGSVEITSPTGCTWLLPSMATEGEREFVLYTADACDPDTALFIRFEDDGEHITMGQHGSWDTELDAEQVIDEVMEYMRTHNCHQVGMTWGEATPE
jgi:hypothetical protein